MARTNSANLDALRPAEKAIYQRVRPYLGRSDLEGMVARIRRAHPVWSDVYNLTPDRVLEVLERLGLESEILPLKASSGAETPDGRGTSGDDAAGDRTARAPSGRRGKRQVGTLPFDTSWLERTGRVAAESAPVGALAAATENQPAAAPEPPDLGPQRAEPEPEPAHRHVKPGPAQPQSIQPPRASRRKKPVEQSLETRAANPPPAEESASSNAEPSGARKARPGAKKRPAGSVDELLQQIDLVASEISGEEAAIEQANRRIADLERRRQALSDQLALTLRSRVPVEILRLAADAGKPSETPGAERRRSSG